MAQCPFAEKTAAVVLADPSKSGSPCRGSPPQMGWRHSSDAVLGSRMRVSVPKHGERM